MTIQQQDRLHELAESVHRSQAAAMNGIGEMLDICQRSRRLRIPSVPPVLAIAVVGIVSLLIGASPPEKTMNASASVLAGQSAMLRRDYSFAIQHFRDAVAAGANPEMCLGLKAECEHYDNNDFEAMKTCLVLEEKTMGASRNAPYIRGLILLKQNQFDSAREQFQIAEMRGHPLAANQLKRAK